MLNVQVFARSRCVWADGYEVEEFCLRHTNVAAFGVRRPQLTRSPHLCWYCICITATATGIFYFSWTYSLLQVKFRHFFLQNLSYPT